MALARSDLTDRLLGHPDWAHTPWLTFDAFCMDYAPHFFDGSDPLRGQSYIIEKDGVPVGHINHNDIHLDISATELDIWMYSQLYCGRSWGTTAIQLLCDQLVRSHGLQRFLVQPSAANRQAIRAYQKVGFRPLALGEHDLLDGRFTADFEDAHWMVKDAQLRVAVSERYRSK